MKMLSADTSKTSSGVFTCQTCNSLFTCLDYYQQHRKDHAQAEGVKLFTCAHCIYVSDNSFHYNWHIMTHASQSPHRCDVCASLADENSQSGRSSWSSNRIGGSGNSSGNATTSRISDVSIGFGKRSVATQSTDDLIYPSSPPPPYQQHNLHTSKSSLRNREDIYNNLETIDARDLLENSNEQLQQNVQVKEEDDDETEEEEQDEEEEDEDEEEEEEQQPYQECDNQQQPMNAVDQQQQVDFYQQEDETDEEEEEEEDEQEQVDDQSYQFMPYQQQQEQLIPNGEYQDEMVEDEDDGTIEDEEAQDLILQEEAAAANQEFQTNQQDYLNGESGAGDLLMDQEYQEEDDDEDDGHDYEAPLEDEDEDEEEEEEEEGQLAVEDSDPTRNKSSDVYEFNSDDDGLQDEHNQSLPNGLGASNTSSNDLRSLSMNQQVPAQQHSTIQLQPTFVHHQPHPHPHHQQHQHHQQGLPTLQPHPQHHQGPVPQPQPGNLQPGMSGVPQNAFQLPPHMTNNNHHHHHPHFITISNAQAPNHQFVGAQQPGSGNSFQLDPATFNGQTIRVLSIQPSFNPNVPQQSQPTPTLAQQQRQQQAQITQQLPIAPQPSQAQVQPPPQMQQQPQTPQQAPLVMKQRKSKKNLMNIDSVDMNGATNGDSPDGMVTTTTPVQQPFVPTKGKGKGNRKPRINFISVINGITVGADGIRRKFHCSHCGNGKSFKTKSHLQRHMLTHTGEKPYQCNECGSKFNQSSSLRNHIIAIHTKKFPHVCTICGKGFLMPAVLQKHIQQTGHYSSDNGNIGSPSTSLGHSEDGINDSKDEDLMMADVDDGCGLKTELMDNSHSEKMYLFSPSS